MVRFMQAGKPRRLVLYCLDEFVDDSLLGTQVGGLIGHCVLMIPFPLAEVNFV